MYYFVRRCQSSVPQVQKGYSRRIYGPIWSSPVRFVRSQSHYLGWLCSFVTGSIRWSLAFAA